MTKADQVLDRAADRLDAFVREAQAAGGVKAKVGDALAEDPEFLRRLKPSLVKARAKGAAPLEEPRRPSAPRPRRPPGGGRNPLLVVAGAFAAGYLLAKIVDWRGYAHPRL
jgi:hypothetical protein